MKAKLLFTRSHRIGSIIIRFGTWSSWSHVDLIIGDFVIGSTSDVGVNIVPMYDRLKHATDYQLMETTDDLTQAQHDQLKQFMISQLGKPYDWAGIFGLPLRRDWEKPDRWFCSEILAAGFNKIQYPLIKEETWRVTPQHLCISPCLVNI